MAELIAIVGESGTGKTTSIRNLNPEEVFIISTTGKRPGVRGAKKKYPDVKVTQEGFTGNFYSTANVDNMGKMMKLVSTKRPEIKTIIVDDFQYIQAFESMERVDEKGYSKFTDMAKHAYEILKQGKELRDDLTVCILTHSENTGDNLNPYFKIKTLGKLLDSNGMREFKQAISDHLFSQVYTQYLDTYRMTTRERYKRLLLRCPEIVQSINLKDIASYLKVTPTTISNIRREITFGL